MVFYFKSTVVTPPVTLFMGLDKYENDELIKWGWPEDVWFHADKVSSAHVYIRLDEGKTIEDIPTAVLDDAAQLVKANSTTGNKMNNFDIIYTMWSNLKKTPSMEAGQVAYFNENEVRKIRVAKRINEIVNRLNKTKTEKSPDLQEEREARDAREKENSKRLRIELLKKQKELDMQKAAEAELRNYTALMKPEKMTSNKMTDGNISDDFM